jgi:hypothetical protein
VKSTRVVIGAALAAGLIGLAAAPAMAADAYNASIAGQRNFGMLASLAPSSTQTVDIVNLPAGVGLYALNCLMPQDPRSAPTVCDQSEGAAAYLPATGALRPAATLPIKVNAEFYGTNPNPTGGDAGGQSVDCRTATGNPRTTTCAVYVIGAGRDSANPLYLRVFPTSYLPVKQDRLADSAAVSLKGEAVARGTRPVLVSGKATPFAVELASGRSASLSSVGCQIGDGTITALSGSGTCEVLITSTGGKNYKPLVTTQTFRLR